MLWVHFDDGETHHYNAATLAKGHIQLLHLGAPKPCREGEPRKREDFEDGDRVAHYFRGGGVVDMRRAEEVDWTGAPLACDNRWRAGRRY